MIFCTQCGTQRNPNDKFCRKCGFAFDTEYLVEPEVAIEEGQADKRQVEDVPFYKPHPDLRIAEPEANVSAPRAKTPETQNLFEQREDAPVGANGLPLFEVSLSSVQEESIFYTPAQQENTSNANIFAPQPGNFFVPAKQTEMPFASSTEEQNYKQTKENSFYQQPTKIMPVSEITSRLNSPEIEEAQNKAKSVFNAVQQESMQQPLVPPAVRLPNPPPPASTAQAGEGKKRGKAGLVVLLITLGLLLFVGATAGMLYWRNSPDSVVKTFIAAVVQKDKVKLSEQTILVDIPNEKVDWDAFCASFDTEEARVALKAQLLSANNSGDYEAVKLQEKDEKLFFIIPQYHIEVSGVRQVVPYAPEGASVQLNEKTHTLSSDGAGSATLENLMPGRYSYKVILPGQESTASVLELWKLTGVANLHTVTIANCQGENAMILVNNSAVSAVPADGTITLDGVLLNSKIEIISSSSNREIRSQVMFVDPQQTMLEFTDYYYDDGTLVGEQTPVPPTSLPSTSLPSTSNVIDPAANPKEFAANATITDISSILNVYYNSYLNCLNTQKIDTIMASTLLNNKSVVDKMSKVLNQGKAFELTSAGLEEKSLVTAEDGGKPSLLFNATFKYTYLDGNERKEGSNTQTVQMIYEDGQWKVNRMTFVSKADYDAHTLATFPA